MMCKMPDRTKRARDLRGNATISHGMGNPANQCNAMQPGLQHHWAATRKPSADELHAAKCHN